MAKHFLHISDYSTDQIWEILHLSKELKTKPTQASIRELRSIGIQPDFIFCRADMDIEQSLLRKISMFCDVKEENVIPLPTLNSIYEVPRHLENFELAETKIRLLIRKYPLFADARAALSALLWRKGFTGEAESNWAAAAGLDIRYRD